MTHKIRVLALCNTFFFMTEEIEAGVKMKPKTRRQKVVYKVHLPHMRRKTAQVKNSKISILEKATISLLITNNKM